MSEAPDYLVAHERAAPMARARTGPLRDVRILDLTQALAGPYCTMLLADLGADVIKVEAPGGDMPRFGGPFMREDEEHHYGAYFASVNRNKRGIVLDLKQAEDRDRLQGLVRGADVVVENFRAGVMERFGLGWETLSARNPRLVYAAIRGFGDPRSGASPYSDWPAFDVVAQAMSGVVSMTGTLEGEMVRVGPSIGDLYPATIMALGIVAAVHESRRTGRGQFVDVAMYDALVALCESAVYRYSYTGQVARPLGNSHPQFTPFDIYPTSDGACAVAAPTPNHWKILCQKMARQDLETDPRTVDNRARVTNAALVREIISAWTSTLTTAQVVDLLAGQVPVGPVNDVTALFADPHLRARDMLVAVDHPGSTRPGVFPAPPIHLSGTPAGVYRRAPILGEHTEAVLAALETAVASGRTDLWPADGAVPTTDRGGVGEAANAGEERGPVTDDGVGPA
jgi:crotonobetainyl-CoA:carnitine CoA-transferase CaiB-like acyl-CoA transferase